MKYLVPLLMLLAVSRVHANLGETEAQIETRYGKPTSPLAFPVESVTRKPYLKNGVIIIVYYLNGKSCSELYGVEAGGHFANTQIESLLEANSLGNKWIKETDDSKNGISRWKLENGSATAKSDNLSGILEITTGEVDKLYKDEEAKQRTVKPSPTKGS